MRKIEEIIHKHDANDTIYVFGKGPSLNAFNGDYKYFKNKTCIAVNDAFLINPYCHYAITQHNEFVFRKECIDYLLNVENYVICAKIPKGPNERHIYDPRSYKIVTQKMNYCAAAKIPFDDQFMESFIYETFNNDITKVLYEVTFVGAVKMALVMGARKIVMLGFDFEDEQYAKGITAAIDIEASRRKRLFGIYKHILDGLRDNAELYGADIKWIGSAAEADCSIPGFLKERKK